MSSSSPATRREFLTRTSAGAMLAGGAVLAGPAARVAGAVAPARTAGAGGPARGIALTHATVIDATGAPPRRDTTVLIEGERITRIGPSAQLPVPPGAQVVDLRGRFVIPGLCDMHAHSAAADIDLPLYVANGVTTVREMWGHPWVHAWRRDIEKGALVGPRFVIASPIIDGRPELWNDKAPRPSAPIVVSGAAEARRAVRDVQLAGADLVKIYSRLSRPAFHAIAAEARRRGIPFGGHCPDVVPVAEASDAGMRTFEHLDGIWWSTSARQAEIERALRAMTIDPEDAYGSWFRQIGVLEWQAATSYRRDKAEALFARLRRNRSWQVPTLTMLQRLDVPGDPDDPRMRYVPSGDAEFWRQWAEARMRERTPEQAAQHRELFERRLRLVGAMNDAGVPLLAGTDVGTTYLFAGFSLHDELALLVRAGLRPLRALQAATRDPARHLGKEDTFGTVRTGRVADLVVLDADPLADIGNTRRIHAVLARGRLITAERRQRLLDGAARAADPPGGAAAAARAAVRGCACRHHAG